MKFYMAPGSCTTGIHILLEELELPFEVWVVNIPAGDNRKPEYLALNPRGTIPTLVLDDGNVLGDYLAISYWLAARHPRRKLLPEDSVLAAKAMSLLSYVTGHVHGQAYTRIFTTDAYTADATQHVAVQARGREMVTQAFELLEAWLPDEGYAVGNFSIADPALFYVAFWAEHLKIPLPPRCQAHYALMRSRPVVQRVLREEGYR
ncbi:glutathione S-transferase family protein [Viridibacterium curvum]|uniref:Glutathione S-transferase family protein n=1 Tax=Viridibacterium curvum TaxID=1101404 RepID=A0ABP9R6F9_9RHOO